LEGNREIGKFYPMNTQQQSFGGIKFTSSESTCESESERMKRKGDGVDGVVPSTIKSNISFFSFLFVSHLSFSLLLNLQGRKN